MTPPCPSSPAFFVLLALAIYTGVTVSFLGRRFGDWRFSWSYILGWVALLMTFFAGERQPEGAWPGRMVAGGAWPVGAWPAGCWLEGRGLRGVV